MFSLRSRVWRVFNCALLNLNRYNCGVFETGIGVILEKQVFAAGIQLVKRFWLFGCFILPQKAYFVV